MFSSRSPRETTSSILSAASVSILITSIRLAKSGANRMRDLPASLIPMMTSLLRFSSRSARVFNRSAVLSRRAFGNR